MLKQTKLWLKKLAKKLKKQKKGFARLAEVERRLKKRKETARDRSKNDLTTKVGE